MRRALPTALGASLPFAVGVFLAFWQLAPVSPQLRIAHVVTRALLAALIGAVATLVIGFVVGVVLNLMIDRLVIVPLAALLLWGWQQSHPPTIAPKGTLDEV